jgi:hypothetical protein
MNVYCELWNESLRSIIQIHAACMACRMVLVSSSIKLSCHRATAAYSSVFQSFPYFIKILMVTYPRFATTWIIGMMSSTGNGSKFWRMSVFKPVGGGSDAGSWNYLSLHETGHVANACVEGINHCVCRTCCCCCGGDPDLPRNIVVSNFGENFEMPSVTKLQRRQRPAVSVCVHTFRRQTLGISSCRTAWGQEGGWA